MGQMVMIPQMGMRSPFMMHAPIHPPSFPPSPNMQNPLPQEIENKKQATGQSDSVQMNTASAMAQSDTVMK